MTEGVGDRPRRTGGAFSRHRRGLESGPKTMKFCMVFHHIMKNIVVFFVFFLVSVRPRTRRESMAFFFFFSPNSGDGRVTSPCFVQIQFLKQYGEAHVSVRVCARRKLLKCRRSRVMVCFVKCPLSGHGHFSP